MPYLPGQSEDLDKEQKRQGVTFIFIATAVVNQTEATDEAGKFYNLKDNNGWSKANQLRSAGRNIMRQPCDIHTHSISHLW